MPSLKKNFHKKKMEKDFYIGRGFEHDSEFKSSGHSFEQLVLHFYSVILAKTLKPRAPCAFGNL